MKCSGECRGAIASKDRFKRKMMKLKEMGKKPNRLDDWRNYSYSCSCQNEYVVDLFYIIKFLFIYRLTDIKLMEIIKSVFFFYYCLILPCTWLGRKVIWGVFKDTKKQKMKARKAVLQKAHKKGKIGKYHFDTEEQLKELAKEPEPDKKSKKRKEKKTKAASIVKQSKKKSNFEEDSKFKEDSKIEEDTIIDNRTNPSTNAPSDTAEKMKDNKLTDDALQVEKLKARMLERMKEMGNKDNTDHESEPLCDSEHYSEYSDSKYSGYSNEDSDCLYSNQSDQTDNHSDHYSHGNASGHSSETNTVD